MFGEPSLKKADYDHFLAGVIHTYGALISTGPALGHKAATTDGRDCVYSGQRECFAGKITMQNWLYILLAKVQF